MINTNELMLGNLVEYRGEYVTVIEIDQAGVKVRNGNKTSGDWRYCTSDEINPIELTDEILKRLGQQSYTLKDCLELQVDSVHKLQIVHYEEPLDITPLLKPKPILTTHDGVEVFDKDAVLWICYEDYTNSFDKNLKDRPFRWIASDLIDVSVKPSLFFSTLEAWQSYIDQKWAELHPEPLFVTEDGVKVFKGMEYYYFERDGYDKNNVKSEIYNIVASEEKQRNIKNIRFSSKPIAQAYLNKVWAENEYQSLLKSKS